jgi:uncharacterized protein (TIGR02246 family)
MKWVKIQLNQKLCANRVFCIPIAMVIYGVGSFLVTSIANNQLPAHANLPNSLITMHTFKTEPIDPNIQQLVERQAKAWETANSDQIIADFSDECLFVVPGSRFRNKQEIKQAAESYFAEYTHTKVTIKRIIAKGNEGAIEWEWSETNKKTGQTSRAEDAIVFELEHGKIKYWREYIDKQSSENSNPSSPY